LTKEWRRVLRSNQRAVVLPCHQPCAANVLRVKRSCNDWVKNKAEQRVQKEYLCCWQLARTKDIHLPNYPPSSDRRCSSTGHTAVLLADHMGSRFRSCLRLQVRPPPRTSPMQMVGSNTNIPNMAIIVWPSLVCERSASIPSTAKAPGYRAPPALGRTLNCQFRAAGKAFGNVISDPTYSQQEKLHAGCYDLPNAITISCKHRFWQSSKEQSLIRGSKERRGLSPVAPPQLLIATQ